jgi:hypothetical protein
MAVEVVQAGEPVRAGLDGVSGLLQELADLADAPVDRLGPNAEQGGDGDLRQAATIRSGASPNTASVSPSARTIDSLPISASSVSSPSGAGSDSSSASTFGRDSRSSSRPHITGPSRPAAVAAKASSNRRQPEATTRSTWPVLGGSTISLQQRRRSAAASRARFVSAGHIS